PLPPVRERFLQPGGDASGTSGTEADPVRVRVVDPAAPLTARMRVHQRTVGASTTIQIRNAHPSFLEVDQIIHLDVRFGRLASLNVIPPDLGVPVFALPESLDFWLDERPLKVAFANDVLNAAFPEARKGAFDVRIAYR